MKIDNPASASSTATASTTKQNEPSAPNADTPPKELSESEYLAQQAHNAQLAMSKAWQDFKLRLGQAVDPLAWTKEHPFMALGAAAVAGFVATATVVPSKEQQALKKLSRIERALNPPPEHTNGDSKHEKGSLLGSILHEAIGVLRPVLMGLISANMGAGMQPPDQQMPPSPTGVPDGQ